MTRFTKVFCLATVGLLLSACSDNDNSGDTSASIDTMAPQISVANQQVDADSTENPISLTVSDDSTATSAIQFEIKSSDQRIVMDGNINLTATGESVTLLITPNTDSSGSVTISIAATDQAQNTAQASFTLDVVPGEVSATAFVEQLKVKSANESPVLINSIELVNDIEDDAVFELLLNQ